MARYIDGHTPNRSNPDALNTVLILAIVGGAGYFGWPWLKDELRKRGITPPGEEPSPVGPPGLPATAFRASVSCEGAILPGADLHVRWTVDHMGPAGSYVCGWEPARANLGCVFGIHSERFQTIEAGLAVNDDTNWTRYVVDATQPFTGGAGAYDVRLYVRSLVGAPLVDYWGCAMLLV